MRAHRTHRPPQVHRSPAAEPARSAEVHRRRAPSSDFERPRAKGPVLAPAQEQLLAQLNEVLQRVASELLAAANGLAPKQAPASPSAAPSAGPAPSAATGPGREFDPTPSGFSPGPPPGVVDTRGHPEPYTIAEKRAASFPAQQPGETLAQYALRTAAQTGFQVNTLGAFVSTASSLGGEPNASFPELMDRFLNPTAYWSKEELDRQNMMRERDIEQANRVFTGPVPIGALTTEDKHYLFAMLDSDRGLYEKVLSGPKMDLSRMINDTVYNLGGANGIDVRTYHGQLRPYVEAILAEKGLKHP